MDNLSVNKLHECFVKIQNEVDKLNKRKNLLKEKRNLLIKQQKQNIKTLWPKRGVWYKILNPKDKNICYHDKWSTRWGMPVYRCFCNDEFVLFKVSRDFTFGKNEQKDDYFELYAEGYIYDINQNKLSDNTNYVFLKDLIESDIIPEKKIIKKEYVDKPTFIYLMRDNINGFHKIGKSKNPKVREKTLQSEKPSIELLFSFEAMSSTEKVLHRKYADKRIRGEWFDLRGSDIDYIKTTYLSY